MNEEQAKQLERLERYWFEEPTKNQPSRAEQFDTMIRYVNNGRFGIRAIIWVGGFTVAVVTGWEKLKSSIMALIAG